MLATTNKRTEKDSLEKSGRLAGSSINAFEADQFNEEVRYAKKRTVLWYGT